jgi:CRP/FNR family transcriptional regulator, cyclic AMP receptor protein
VPDRIEDIWARSCLAEVSDNARDALLATAHEEEFSRGFNVYRELRDPRFSFLALVISGMLRMYVTSPQGRRMVLHYVRPGGIVGLTAAIVGGAPAGLEAVRKGSMLRLDPVAFRSLAQTDSTVGWAIAKELARLLADDDRMRTANVFGSVRERLARHLLELVTEEDDRLVAHVTQQELADSVGSVREVVARAVLELRDEGVVVREGPRIVVVNPERLEKISRGEAT